MNDDFKIGGNRWYEFFKRLFDLISSGLFLIIFGWFILLLMFIKWIEDVGVKSCTINIKKADVNTKKVYYSKDGKEWEISINRNRKGEKDSTVIGPIYTSERVGKNGKIFKFHKIRSMCKGAESMKTMLRDYGLNEADEPAFKISDDPRITKFGKFLRKTSLDELPQIWDVFLGNMSIIGPRPPIPHEVEKYSDKQKNRLRVKGGLLCTWQITKNRNSLPFDEWVNLDLEYIKNRSLLLDAKILFKAIIFILTDRSGE